MQLLLRQVLAWNLLLFTFSLSAQSFGLSVELGVERRIVEHNITPIAPDLITIAYSRPRGGKVLRLRGFCDINEHFAVSVTGSFHERYFLSYNFQDFTAIADIPEVFLPISKVISIGGQTLDLGIGGEYKVELLRGIHARLGFSAGVLFRNRNGGERELDLGRFAGRIEEVAGQLLEQDHKNQSFIRPSISISYRFLFIGYAYQQTISNSDYFNFTYDDNLVSIQFQETFHSYTVGLQHTF